MPSISFVKNRPPILVANNARLMKELLAAGLPVASSCNGDGVCGKCRLRIVAGQENLSPIETTEELLRSKYQLAADQRISCQARVLGDITVDAPYW